MYALQSPYLTVNRVVVVKLLLEAGAPVNAVNSGGNTPLHAAVFEPPEPGRSDRSEIIDLLLQHGAHVDATNDARRSASDLLAPDVVFNHVSLQCRAARAIRRDHQLPYRRLLPTMLADFVDRH